MTSTQHTGAIIKLADAEDMLAEICKIMTDKALNYGPAVDEYIRRRQSTVQYKTGSGTWRTISNSS